MPEFDVAVLPEFFFLGQLIRQTFELLSGVFCGDLGRSDRFLNLSKAAPRCRVFGLDCRKFTDVGDSTPV